MNTYYEAVLCILAVMSSAAPAVFVWAGKLNLRRDFIPILLYLQFIVYLHLAPTVFALSGGTDQLREYCILSFSALLLFEIPFLLTYLLLIGRRTRAIPPLQVTPVGLRVGSIYTILISALFAFVVTRNGIWYLWYGNEMNTQIVASLPTLDWFVFRGVLQGGIVIICAWLIIVRTAPSAIGARTYGLVALVALSTVLLGWSLMNSRSSIVIAAAFITYVLLLTTKTKLPVRMLLGCAVFILYGARVVTNVRESWSARGEISAEVLSPMFDSHLGADVAKGDDHNLLAMRLNGIDAMARMAPGIAEQGLSWGTSWADPIKIYFLQPVARLFGFEIKVASYASPKVLLLGQYAGMDIVDYEACNLTDIYGNFGVIAFPLVGGLLAFVCATGVRIISRGGLLSILIGCTLLFSVFAFESEFLVLTYGWMRVLVFVGPLCLIWRVFSTAPRTFSRFRSAASVR